MIDTSSGQPVNGQVAWFGPGWGRPQSEPGRLRAAVMTRLSRDSEDSTSIAAQEDDGRTLCRLRGWDVVLVTYDVGVSGATRPEDRPGFGVILDNLPHVDVVVARSIDRFTRHTAHFAGLVETLDAGGATLVDVAGQVDLTSPYGRFVTTIMVAFAQMEREMIQGRILRSRVALRQAGRWLGGAAPYGFKIVSDGQGGKVLDLDPYAAGVLRKVIQRVIGDGIKGVTLSSEVDRLNREGILSPLDYRKMQRDGVEPTEGERAEWTYSPLYQHLRSEVLRGYRVVGKRGTRKVVKDAENNPVKVGPELVTGDVWRALQAALDRAAVEPRRPRRKATLLLHVAECSLCPDPTLYYNSREYQEERRDLYNCSAARNPQVRKAGPCPGVAIRADKLEPLVEGWFLTRFGAFEFTERVEVGGNDVASAIADLEADIAELVELAASLRGAPRQAISEHVNARLSALEELRAQPVVGPSVQWRPTGRTVAEEWAARDVAQRRLMLLGFNVRVTIDPAYGARTWNPDRVHIDVVPADPAAEALRAVMQDEEDAETY